VAQDVCQKTNTHKNTKPTQPHITKSPKKIKSMFWLYEQHMLLVSSIYKKKTLQHHKDIKNQKQVRAINWKGEIFFL
jgi:hypothetical protein